MTLSPERQPFPGDGTLRAALASEVQVRTFDGELIVLDSKSGDYFAVNEVGADFLKALEEGCSVEECARRLHDSYAVAWMQLCSDLLELARELLSRRLIVPRATRSAVVEASS